MSKKHMLELWGIRGDEEGIRRHPTIYPEGWLCTQESDTKPDVQFNGVALWFSREAAEADANTTPDFPETVALWGRATIERVKAEEPKKCTG